MITFPNLRFQMKYEVFSSPITFVANQYGQVEKIWSGKFNELELQEAREYFVRKKR